MLQASKMLIKQLQVRMGEFLRSNFLLEFENFEKELNAKKSELDELAGLAQVHKLKSNSTQF